MIRRLDRLLFLRVAMNTALIAFGTTMLALGLEMIMEANQLFGKQTDGASRAWLIIRYYGYKIAPTLSPLLPLSLLAATLITMTAMLRRNELLVLVAGGMSMRRACRSLIVLALGVGLIDFILVDQIMPQQEGDRLALDNQLTGQETGARLFVAPNGARWAARSVNLQHDQAPTAFHIAVFTDAQLLRADRLFFEKPAKNDLTTPGHWVLENVVIADRGEQQQQPRSYPLLRATNNWDLPYRPEELRATLASIQALPSKQLWQRGGRDLQGIVLARYAHLLTALAILFAALPTFVRYQNRTNLIGAAGQTLVVGVVTWGCSAGMSSIAAMLPLCPLIGTAIGTVVLWSVLLIRWYRWSF
jgi:lipopolysaccharide export LptBFGC system permease protein LptF